MITRKGYVRLKTAQDRDWLEHRAVTRDAIREFCPKPLQARLGRDGLPVGMHVHHADWRKKHNCRENLQLLQSEIHSFLCRQKILARRRVFVQEMIARGYCEAVALGASEVA